MLPHIPRLGNAAPLNVTLAESPAVVLLSTLMFEFDVTTLRGTDHLLILVCYATRNTSRFLSN